MLAQDVVSPARVDRVLDQIAGPDFLTDWGVRSLAASDPAYDPNLYSAGSVWALGSASVAETMWRLHRPATGWAIWQGLAAGDTLDSAGHLHEVMAGDLYHPELESVPEQTWSSAGLLLAAVRGMLGLAVDGGDRHVVFAPHLPPGWNRITLRNVRVGADRLTLALTRDARGIALDVTNAGAPLSIDFAPMLPLGARLGAATLDDRAVPVASETNGRDAHARLRVEIAGRGTTRIRIACDGGVDVAPVDVPPMFGAHSRRPILRRAQVVGDALDVETWVLPGDDSVFALHTARRIVAVTGTDPSPDGGDRHLLTVKGDPAKGDPTRYALRRVRVTFAP